MLLSDAQTDVLYFPLVSLLYSPTLLTATTHHKLKAGAESVSKLAWPVFGLLLYLSPCVPKTLSHLEWELELDLLQVI